MWLNFLAGGFEVIGNFACKAFVTAVINKLYSGAARSTIIDLIGLDNLTNKVRGLHSRSFGRISVEDIILKYTTNDVEIKDDKVILISVGKSYSSNMSQQELFEYSRGIWRVNEKRHKADYALIVFQGIIREVYKISKWYKAGTLTYKYRNP